MKIWILKMELKTLEYNWAIYITHEKECSGYDTKLNLMVKVLVWRFAEFITINPRFSPTQSVVVSVRFPSLDQIGSCVKEKKFLRNVKVGLVSLFNGISTFV